MPATKIANGTSGDNPRCTKTASGTSGDNPRRSPFWRLWVLRLPQGRQPAATTRAAAPSGGSGYCTYHEDSQRTTGDNPRRNPFWRLWVLRLPQGRQPATPAATTRAATPSGGSGYCAYYEDSQRDQWRQPAPQPLLADLGTAPVSE